jgi:hypothetical protein
MPHNFGDNQNSQTEKTVDVPLCAEVIRLSTEHTVLGVLCNWYEIEKLGEKIGEIWEYRNAITLVW